MTAVAPRGIDLGPLTAWLVGHVGGLRAPLRFTRVGEGQSNLTFRLDDAAGQTLVLRRPPLGEILASAHDMAREHRILSGISAAGGRVPRPLAFCDDPAVTGAPFYVMEYVDGAILTKVVAAEGLAREARAHAGRSLVETLAEIQAVDLDTAGLADFKREESLAARQLRRWTRQWHASKTRELPVVEEVADVLAARLPDEHESVLVHGDYRLDNAVLSEQGDVKAVLDWELCTVGDPLADVGLMLAYWTELGAAAGGPAALFREPVTEVDGFVTTDELAAEYARASGRSLDALPFWVAFAYWKVAVIVEGVYRRWLNDPENGSDAGGLKPAVERLATRAQETLA